MSKMYWRQRATDILLQPLVEGALVRYYHRAQSNAQNKSYLTIVVAVGQH